MLRDVNHEFENEPWQETANNSAATLDKNYEFVSRILEKQNKNSAYRKLKMIQ